MLELIGAGLGALAGLAQGPNKLRRREEEYNRNAAKMIRSSEARNNNINAGATSRAQQQAITATQQGAVGAAANASAGQTAQGGDYSNPLGAGIAMAQSTQAAGAPYSQQVASAIGQADQTRAQQASMTNQNANSMASLSNHVSYESMRPKNPLLDMMVGGQGGANSFSNIWALINKRNQSVGTEPPTTA